MIARLPGVALGAAIAAITVTTGRPVTIALAALSIVFAVTGVRWTGCRTACAASAVAGITADQLQPSPRLTSAPIVVLALLLTAYLLIADGRLARPRTWTPALAAITAIATTVAAGTLRLPAPAVLAGLAATAAAAMVAALPLHRTERRGDQL